MRHSWQPSETDHSHRSEIDQELPLLYGMQVALSQTPPTGDIGCAEKSYDDDDIWTPVPLSERRCIRRDMSPNRAREKPQDDKQSGNKERDHFLFQTLLEDRLHTQSLVKR